SGFLNRLSNAARASLALRGSVRGTPETGPTPYEEEGCAAPSRATVTRGLNRSHWLAWSFTTIRTGTGFRHWNRVDGSKYAHCLQQCRAVPHLGQFPPKSMSDGN